MKTTLISVTELAALPPSEVLIVDCRYDQFDAGKGERDYRAAHIPGAVFASLDRDLSDLSRIPMGLGRHPLPTEEVFSVALSRWGWHPGLQVVCYDAGNGALAAARLWWLLRLCGVKQVAVVDGGYAAWTAADQLVSQDIPQPAQTSVSLHYDPVQVLVDHAAVAHLKHDLLLDARATSRYLGEVEPLDRAAGHVPGAANRPFSENLQPDGRFKSAAVLRQEFLAVMGNHKPEQVVHMCGSGVTACHNLLAMEHAGLAGSRLYAPSWSGWVSDPSRSVATGSGS
ncbi:sulfurtransferase [Dyella caseinilytica]|uniref:Sulfurtransferase n=1 Tax=Dyella caseinilytica TaxID=1849581 RepID=A0ABX7GYC1_9GAMM|nr:sulfurtransferase [Dyella caseinilytica]QRN54948.1 sulfurtransferase [Dyella caseinilytica]GFZ98168.1 thiosulfate sulfurtransferase [Dyella caseinilytica]